MKTNETPPVAEEIEAGKESELCISCLKPNAPGTSFCKHCGTPLTSYAATAPFESMFAEGDFWRKAIAGPRGKPWVRYVAIGFLTFILLAVLSGMVFPR